MKYRAVIFDLFGTLAENFSTQGYMDALAEMASVLGLPSEEFQRAWFSTSRQRNRGDFQEGCEGDVRHVCREFGVSPGEGQIALAVEVRLDHIRHLMTPRRGATEVLARLRAEGYRVGLVSDCTHEVPTVWPETALAALFDAAVFSCVVRMRKPDPRIYLTAAEQLSVLPDECLYVGDGGSRELSGALEVGMHPVLIRLDADSSEPHLANREEWEGPSISSLAEVLRLVREG